MTDRIPVKAVVVGGAATGLAEFATGDTVPVALGGTGVDTLAKIKTALDIANVTDAAVAAKFDKAGGAFSGNVGVTAANPRMSLTKTGNGQDSVYFGNQGAFARWAMALGDTSSETGGNAGSNFALYRYTDGGGFLGTALSISRSDGSWTLNGSGTVNGQVVANGGFLAPGGPSGQWMLRSSSMTQEGSYRVVHGVSLDAIGDIANIRAYHYPGVESFTRIAQGGSGNYFQFSNNGNAYAFGAWGQTSDQRVKYDNQRIENALDKVDQLHGYTFIRQDLHDMQGNMPRRAGVIAQDVLKVLPEAVTVPANYDAEKIQGDLLSLEYSALSGLFVEAIKALRAEVKDLRAELRELRFGTTTAVDANVKGEPAALPAPIETTSAPGA